MAELERSKTISLVKPIAHDASKTTYEVVELSELPCYRYSNSTMSKPSRVRSVEWGY